MSKSIRRYSCIVLVFVLKATIISAQADTVLIKIDAKKSTGLFIPLSGFFGYDEANYTTANNGEKLLTELAQSNRIPVHVRVHNLLTTGDGKAALKWSSTNAYTEDANGNAVYNWAIVDSIFDVFIQRAMKPIAEIGFMPEALSVKPEPYRHHWKPGVSYDSIYTGWAYPPRDYKKWSELIYQWVTHCVKRYGKNEVKSWYWEVWNEPNIGYWKGTMQEYFTLYDYTVDAVKKALPLAIVGGPTSTGPRWNKAADFLKKFLQHCVDGENSATGKKGAPLDYITFHAKGDPEFVNGHVQMNMAAQLQDVARGFEIIQSFPSLKNLPVIIGEFDPEGCAACSVQFNPQNAYRNGTMYSSYTAASFAQLYVMKEKYNINLIGAVSWSFEFEDQPWFAGFRDLATNGVDKPVLNVFRMFGFMEGNILEVKSSGAIPLQKVIDSSVRGDKPYVDALAASYGKSTEIMVWNYHDNDNAKTTVPVKIELQNLSDTSLTINCYLVDETHSNSYSLWQKMGAPQQVSKKQFRKLKSAGLLQRVVVNKHVKVLNGTLKYQLNLQGQGVALIRIGEGNITWFGPK